MGAQINFLKTEIVIVDDGSVDNTLSVIKKFISTENLDNNFSIKIINHTQNKGLGTAIKSGFEYVLKNYNNSNNFMFLDPPYDSEFTDYGYCSFGKEEHKKLAECYHTI